MIAVAIPQKREAEHRYIVSVLLEDFLGLDVQILIHQKEEIFIQLPGGAEIIIPSLFLCMPDQKWLKEDYLPVLPMQYFKNDLPVFFGQPNVKEENNKTDIGFDLFGAAFFMLTRYEEYIEQEKDQHARCMAKNSFAYKAGFLDRPIVNEYLDFLWDCMKKLCPVLERKEKSFELRPTHDADIPYFWDYLPFLQMAKIAAARSLKRLKFYEIPRTYFTWRGGKSSHALPDPYDTHSFLMEESEKNNAISHFYFKPGYQNKKWDAANYHLSDPKIENLLSEISERGHKIGFHPSYKTFHNAALFSTELEHLKTACKKNKIEQEEWGGRQHYLRWRMPESLKTWEENGLDYDSTLGYADHVGFRCGTCYDFPLFDLSGSKQLKLREYPLIVMEGTVFGYMGIKDYAQAFDLCLDLKRKCQKHNGIYTILWHNSAFESEQDKEFYASILSAK